MKKLLTLMITLFLSFPILAEQGTMSTDDTSASDAEASMSGTADEEIDLREEEVQMQEEKFDPTMDDEPIIIEQDAEELEEYEEEPISY